MRFRRFAAGFMAAIIVITSSVPVAYADWEDVIYETVMVPFSKLTVHAVETFADIINGAGNALIRDPILKAHDFWSQWIRDESLEYRDFISSLDATTAQAFPASTGVHAKNVSKTYIGNYGGGQLFSILCSTYPAQMTDLIESLGVYNKVFVWSMTSEVMFGVYFDGYGRFRAASFVNPIGQVNASLIGIYLRSELELDNDNKIFKVYYSKSYAEKRSDYLTTAVWAFDFSRDITVSNSRYGFNPYLYKKLSTDTTWLSGVYNDLDMAFPTTPSSGSVDYIYYSSTLYWDSSYLVTQPSDTDSSSRTGSLMQTFDIYNTANSYVDNSTSVNYFIGSLGTDGNVTDVYSPALYDEETLIFTEPVTGTQYQTNGWTYDYTTRTYYMTLDSGTMYIDGTEVTAVYLVYGDDNVEISYLSGSGATELIQTDTYAYVMVSQSACNINGHTNTVTSTKDPTCTASGERTYTCSICGNQTVEEIPATGGHAYEYSIYQAATCTAAGIGLYTCSSCGDQYTEPIPAIGHTDKLIQYVPTEYDDNGAVIATGYSVYECEVCGTQYTIQDEIPVEEQDWFTGFGEALIAFGKAAWSVISTGLGKVFSGFADLLGGIFGFFTDTVIGGVKSFFSTLSDDSILGYYQDDTGAAALPEGVGSAMAMIPAFFGGLPAELQAPVIFGIAALFLIAALKLFL